MLDGKTQDRSLLPPPPPTPPPVPLPPAAAVVLQRETPMRRAQIERDKSKLFKLLSLD
jgi:hypothetical protein